MILEKTKCGGCLEKKVQEFRGLGERRVRQAVQRRKGLGTVALSGNQHS